MWLYFPVDLTGNLVMIEKLVLGEIWTWDLPIFNPDALTSALSNKLLLSSEDKMEMHSQTISVHEFLSDSIFNFQLNSFLCFTITNP